MPDSWLVDPAAPSITVLESAEGTHRVVASATGDEAIDLQIPVPPRVNRAARCGTEQRVDCAKVIYHWLGGLHRRTGASRSEIPGPSRDHRASGSPPANGAPKP